MKRQAIGWVATVVATYLALVIEGDVAANADYVSPFVIGFEGEAPIGANAASTLYLRLWSTMRRHPWPNSDGLDFGNSITQWDSVPVQPYTHEEAMHRAILRGAHIVLWGRAHRYGGGLLIEGRISIPDYPGGRAKRLESWQVVFNNRLFDIRFPNRRIEWANVVLDPEAIARLDEPFGVPIFETLGSPVAIGYMSGYVKALQFVEGAAKVEDLGKVGWIRFPPLGGKGQPTVILAAGGITRMFRGDYNGAIRFFSEILDQGSDINMLNKIDIHLLRGVSLELTGKSGLEDFKFGFDQNPFSSSTLEHYIGGVLSKNNNMDSEEKVKIARKILEDYGVYLGDSSSFRNFQ